MRLTIKGLVLYNKKENRIKRIKLIDIGWKLNP